MRWVPVDEVSGLVWLRPSLWIPVDIGENRRCNAMALIGDQFAKGLQRVIGLPLSQFSAVDFPQQLTNGLAQRQR